MRALASLQPVKSVPTIVWLLVLSFLLRLPFVFRSPIGDENLTLQGIRIPLGKIVSYLSDPLNRDPYPPLFYWLMHLWDRIVPSHVWDRLLLVFIGTGSVYVTYHIGKLLHDEKLGLSAAFLLACFPQAVWSDQWLRAYSMSAFLSGAVAVSYLYIIKKRNTWAWVAFFLSCICLLYSFYFGAVVIIALGLHFLFLVEKNRQLCLRWLTAHLVILICFAPWIPKMLAQFAGSTGVPKIVQKEGFWIGNWHIGALINGWLGTFGLDSLWNPAPIGSLPTHYLLLTMLFAAMVGALTIPGWWKAFHLDKKLLGHVLWFSLIPALIGFILHQITSVPLVHHYYAIVCWGGAIALGLSVTNLRRGYRFALIGMLAATFTWRLTELYTILVVQGSK